MMTRYGRTVSTLLGCALLLSAPYAAAGAEPEADEMVVPPGQEELLAQMLGRGAKLPDACRFAGAHADGPVVDSTYECPGGEVLLRLTHASRGADTATLTQDFAITVHDGSPPGDLVDTVASLVQSQETEFAWVRLVHEPSEEAE